MTTSNKLLLSLALLGLSANAYAYLDAGTMTLVIQGLVAAFGTALVALKLYWHRLKVFFSRGRSPRKSAAGARVDAMAREGDPDPARGADSKGQ